MKNRIVALPVALVACAALAAGAAADPPPPPPPPPPPVPTITATPPAISNQTSATFEFSDTDTSVTFECALQAPNATTATFSPCASPATYLDLTPDGAYTFTVRAVQGSIESAPATPYTWTIDTTAPKVQITKGPGSVAGPSAAFEFTNDDPTATVSCTLDAAASACSSPVVYSGLANGAHTFVVSAKDAAGNVGSANYAWTVDATAPTLSLGGVPALRTSDTSATFAFTGDAQTAGYLCSLDTAAFAPCSPPVTYGPLADGGHTFRVEATDTVGNVGTPLTYTWTVDTTPPAPASDVSALVRYKRVTLSWQLPSDSDFDHLTLFSRAPRSTQSLAAYKGRAQTLTRNGIDNSRAYRYTIVSYDSVGNASAPTTIQIPPSSLLLSPRPGARVRVSPRFSWSPAPGAAFYNVQLFHKGKKVLSTWPRSTRLQLARHWTFAGQARALGRGWYDWYVWPAFGRGKGLRYGTEVGHSSFRVR